MGILGRKPFLTKKGIGTDMPKSELKIFVEDRTVLVDVLASHYFMMLRLSKIEKNDEQREYILSYLKKLYVEQLGLNPKKMLFAFDGDLHAAKWNTKRQRMGSSILQQAKQVWFKLIIEEENIEEDQETKES